MWIIFTTLFCVVTCSTASRQEFGLCSQVYLMSQYCSNNDVTPPTDDVTVIKGRVGKAGARGPPGERGLPGFVNYSDVEDRVAAKIKEVEDKFAAKFAEFESATEQTVSNLERKLTEMTIFAGCHEAMRRFAKVKTGKGGIFDVYLDDAVEEVFCDLSTDGGKWTVFQRRLDGSVDFNRDWDAYVAGFGNLTGEFWLGLEKLHWLTQDGNYQLRIEMTDRNGRVGTATYQSFSISGSSENYKLNVGGFSGTGGAGDWLNWHNNMAFSTRDRDNDVWSSHCAAQLKGGWWFRYCHYSSLNGVYGETGGVGAGQLGIYWSGFSNIKKTEMKFRKK